MNDSYFTVDDTRTGRHDPFFSVLSPVNQGVTNDCRQYTILSRTPVLYLVYSRDWIDCSLRLLLVYKYLDKLYLRDNLHIILLYGLAVFSQIELNPYFSPRVFCPQNFLLLFNTSISFVQPHPIPFSPRPLSPTKSSNYMERRDFYKCKIIHSPKLKNFEFFKYFR